MSRASYDNIATKWVPEIKHHSPGTPIVLVGTKIDIREEQNIDHLTEMDGKKLKRKIKAVAYVECSAKEMYNLEQIFITAIRAVAQGTHIKRKPQCIIL